MIVFWIGELEMMRTQASVRDGRHDEAAPRARRGIEFLQRAQKLGFRRYQSLANIGEIHSMMGELPEAVTAFESVQAAGRLDRRGMQRLGSAYAGVGRCADAERILVSVDGGNPSAGNRYVAHRVQPARWVDDAPTFNQQIVFGSEQPSCAGHRSDTSRAGAVEEGSACKHPRIILRWRPECVR